jgi:aminoglycoside phosphotransferase (APT) family kinase protein
MEAESVEQYVNREALERYVNERVPGTPGPLTVRKHTAGYSNVTLFVDRGDEQWVLRRPPVGHLLPTAHDVLREHRFISALHGKARVPRPILVCEDTSVIGAPFYLMERVQGSEIRDRIPAAFDNPAGRRRIAEEMIDALVELHAVDWQAAGLPGKSKGYVERQLERWSSQWALTRERTRQLPGLDRVTQWLHDNMPPPSPATVAHGDFKLDNVLFSPGEPRLLAILDWELATIGEPLADVGWLLSGWGNPNEGVEPDPDPARSVAAPVTTLPGFPSVQEMAQLYEERGGRHVGDYRYYLVFAMYRGTVIGEGIYMRYLEGNLTNPAGARMEWQVPQRLQRMLRVIEETRLG